LAALEILISCEVERQQRIRQILILSVPNFRHAKSTLSANFVCHKRILIRILIRKKRNSETDMEYMRIIADLLIAYFA
jgi:hypothetical protein